MRGRSAAGAILLTSFLSHASWTAPRLLHIRTARGADAICLAESVPDEVEKAVGSLAAVTLALLSGDEPAAKALAGSAENKRETIQKTMAAYDVCQSGTLSYEEACALFTKLARSIVEELAAGEDTREVARAQAQRILENDARGTIDRVATKLMLLADADGDGRINLGEPL